MDRLRHCPSAPPPIQGMRALALLAWGCLFLLLPAPLRGEEVLRVGLYENPPKIFTSPSGRPEGIFPDLIRAIAAQEGWTLKFVPGTWAQCLDRLGKGELDILPDVSFSPERARLYSFPSEPVLSDWLQVYALPGSDIRSLPDLNGKRVALLAGSIQEDSLRTLAREFELSVTPVPFPSFDEAFRAVEEGRADAVLSNRFFGHHNRDRFRLEETGVIFRPSKLFFALSPLANPAIAEGLDRQLRLLKEDPQSAYYKSLGRWLSGEVQPGAPPWVEGEVYVLLGLLFLGIAFHVALHRRIGARTRELESANQALALSRNTWRSTFDAVQDALWVLDADAVVLSANAATQWVLGTDPRTVEGRPWSSVREEHLPTLDDGLLQAARTSRRRESTYLCREDRWFKATVDPIPGEGGTLRGFILSVGDITDLKRAEEEIEEKAQSISSINRKLQESVVELKNTLQQTIQILVNASELKDPYTAGHQRRVATLGHAIALEMGLTAEKARRVELAGLVHDIGKIEIPSEILVKPRRLSDIEYRLVQTHPAAAFRILKDVPAAWPLAEIVYQHHERLDGSGYPRNLRGDAILLEARILSVADTVEAMSTHRPYRAARGVEAALKTIEAEKGTSFDPLVVDACVRLFRQRGFSFREIDPPETVD